ncbi:MAG: 3-isopropylmalate dehydratase large subunit [Sphaerochaetaceae bacterium]
MHALEKILARASGNKEVKAGQIIMANVDFAEVNDIYLQAIRSFYEMGGRQVWDKDKLTFVFDHYAPAPSIEGAQNHKKMREFAVSQNLTHHFDVEKGVCHQVLPEAGLIYPGIFFVATDSHTTTHGAFGAFGTGIGATDMATVMMEGKLWIKVPEVIQIRLEGTPGRLTLAKDVALFVVGQLKADGAIYQAIEFCGSYVDNLSIASRMVLCNLAVEMGAKTAYIQPDETVFSYLREKGVSQYTIFETDEDYSYAHVFTFNIDDMEPQIAIPHSVDSVVPLSKVPKVKVNQCLIGTCTGGREEDFRIAAKIIGDRHIASGTRLLILPASDQVLLHCLSDGTMQQLLKAGATLVSPGCGPCLGAHEGLLAPGDVCITTSNRNFPGRMGSRDAEIYLASPAVVAESAIQGMLSSSIFHGLQG